MEPDETDQRDAGVTMPVRLFPSPSRSRSRFRWRLRWGRPLPWPTRVEIVATLCLWLAGVWAWDRWERGQPLRLPTMINPGPAASARTVAATAPGALLLTAERPDPDGLFAYGQDRLTVRVPVALRQATRPAERPDLSHARGLDGDGLRFELTRVFDPRAHSTDATDLAHDRAAVICRAAGATLVDAVDEGVAIPGAGEKSAVHTVIHTRLANGNSLTIEGLTVEDASGPVAWTLWAGYPGEDRRAAALVRASFGSAALRELSGR